LHDGAILLADDFPAGDPAAWMALVEKTLGGQAFDKRLVARTYDGLRIEPLYTSANGARPLGGAAPAPRADGRWDIRARVLHPDPAAANLAALEELEGGASSLLVSVDPSGATGVAVGSAEDLETVLHGVFMDLAPVALEAGPHSLTVGQWLLDLGEARTLRPKLALHIDPLSNFAATGVALGGITTQIELAASLAKREVATSLFLASGQVVHEAGGGEAAELGFAAASALAYARAMIEAGATPAKAFGAIAFGLAADGDYFLTLAKLRAARALWSRITGAATGTPLPATIEARSSRRMLAALDPWVNLLRLTSAAFGAATGGADCIVLDAFTQPLGRPTQFARRQARNTQLVLMEESHLGRVLDPGSGSWYIETLSRELALAGWAFMQNIEAAGGAAAALENGLLAEAVADTCKARTSDLASRKAGLIGVSEYPDLAEAGVDLDLADASPFAKPAPPALPGPASHCRPLSAWRAAAPFERLRRQAAAMQPRPRVFLATLGAPADYAARVGFARNLFAAGGIAVDVADATEFQPENFPIAVICSSDARYADEAEAAAQALKAAGARHIYLAGRPGELQTKLEAAGVHGFIYAGVDAPTLLSRALDLAAALGAQA